MCGMHRSEQQANFRFSGPDQSSVPDKMKENCSFQSLFFISLPDLRKLCGVTVSLNCDDADVRSLQIITCRELLFLYPEVVAAPGEYKEIILIMPIPFYKTGNIQTYVQKWGGKMDVPQRVIPTVLQTCLSFALVAKLSPNWNKVGHLLIHGKDFLRKAEKQNAVVMELNVSETQLCISVEASTIRLSLAKVEDFDVSTGVLKSFYHKRVAVIPKHFIASKWCYVLPSMKKGQIVSISHEIPPHCPFQSYGDFQKHWKNMYGYNLPECNDDATLYYTVYFKLIGEKLFTYPFCCIRSEPVQFFPRVDLEAVLTSFFSDLKVNLPNLCGLPIKMTNKPYYATNELNISQTVQTRPPNLTTKPVFKTALTKVPTATYVINKSSSTCPTGGSPNTRVLDNEQKIDIRSRLEPGSANTAMQCGTTFRSTDKTGVVFHSLSEKSQVTPLAASHQMEVHSTSYSHSSKTYKIIPIFKSKLLQQDKQFISEKVNASKTKQYVELNSKKPLTLKSSTANTEVKRTNNMREKESRSEKETILLEITQKQKSITNIRVEKPCAKLIQNVNSNSEVSISNILLHKSKTSTDIEKPGARPLQTFGKNQDLSTTNIQMGGKTTTGVAISDGPRTKWNDNLAGSHQRKQVLHMFDVKEPHQQEKQMSTQFLNLKPLTERHFSDMKGPEKRKCEERDTLPDLKS
ncbi:hypothetical protein scyTo_0003158 [Scyliorhinus torazame]|uniref:DUF4708 domain-containing protein n=1 Tax=Scyliorhinus torazame TaxID=75743 RepID=A0A401PLT7_SCYTO|nr:hypothetical protein [Scyliorhinus torazame]